MVLSRMSGVMVTGRVFASPEQYQPVCLYILLGNDPVKVDPGRCRGAKIVFSIPPRRVLLMDPDVKIPAVNFAGESSQYVVNLNDDFGADLQTEWNEGERTLRGNERIRQTLADMVDFIVRGRPGR